MKTTTLRARFALPCVAAAAIAVAGCDASPDTTSAPADPKTSSGPAPTLSYEDLVEVVKNPDDFAKARKLGELLPDLGPESIPAAKEALEEAAALEMGAVEFELLMRYWALHDPSAASMYALMTAPRAYQVAAIHAAVTPWFEKNPQEALPAIRPWTVERGDAGGAAQIALVRGWYASGQPGLEEYIHDLGTGFERQRALAAYSTAIVRKHGVDALVTWAEAVPDDDAAYKLDVFRNAATALVPYEREAAKDFCDRHCEGPFGSNLRSRIASRWARDDAAAALDWLGTAPEGQDTSRAVRYSYAIWGGEDRPAALLWMKGKLNGGKAPEWLEAALPIYARMLFKDSPTEGLAVATTLPKERERAVVTIELAHQWREQDTDAAEAWLAQASLSPRALELIRMADRPRIKGDLEALDMDDPNSGEEVELFDTGKAEAGDAGAAAKAAAQP